MEAQTTKQSTSQHTQLLTGAVVSTKMTKTVVVEVKTRKRHPKYHKAYTVTKRYKAHTENEKDFVVGDRVEIASVRPMSAEKRFRVVKKV